MYRGTTPTLTFNIKSDIDLENVDIIFITLKAAIGDRKRDYDKERVEIDSENKKIYLPLTQQDTLYFKGDKYFDEGRIVQAQIRIKDTDGNAYASNIMSLELNDILKDGEI